VFTYTECLSKAGSLVSGISHQIT